MVTVRPDQPDKPQISPLSPVSPLIKALQAQSQPQMQGCTSLPPTPPPETDLPAHKAKVYFPNPVHPNALSYAKTRFGGVVVGDELGQAAQADKVDGIINRANVLSAETLASFPRLVGVSIVGVGYDAVDVAACRERRIAVMNCPGGNADAVAELTLCLTLCLLRHVPTLDRRLRVGDTVRSFDVLGHGLRGKKVGMVGMGSTARKAAELFCHAFNCEIHVYSPTSPQFKWTCHDHSAPPISHTRHAELQSMLPRVDILTLHCPLTPSTGGLISDKELRAMQPHTVLVNMSRGAVVDESALFSALNEGCIAGAASDVFRVEPAHRGCMEGLMDLENFVATPHIGGATVEAQIDVCLQAIDQLADLFDGRPVSNRVA